MQNQEEQLTDIEIETMPFEIDDWANFKDNDIMEQQSAIQAEEAVKIPFVGDKAREFGYIHSYFNFIIFLLMLCFFDFIDFLKI